MLELKSVWANTFFDYVGECESPDLFTYWAGLSIVAAVQGRKTWFNWGRYRIYPNMYVVLAGPAAVRKSTSANTAVRLIKKYLKDEIKFGPADTAGKKQGLLAQFIDAYKEPEEDELKDLDNLFGEDSNPFLKETIKKKPVSPHKDLYVVADEISNFLGVSAYELIALLTQLFEPQDEYHYKLAKSSVTIRKPGLNLLLCGTPTDISRSLTTESLQQGFVSRTTFVYSGQKKPKVFWAEELDEEKEKTLGKSLSFIHYQMRGPCSITDQALRKLKYIYEIEHAKIDDSRFVSWEHRRMNHIIKLAMNIAAGNAGIVKSKAIEITKADVEDAHILIQETEKDMSAALGELGMSKLSIAKQHMREMIENSWPVGITYTALKSNLARDMTQRDIAQTLQEFINKGICITTTMKISGETAVVIMPKAPDSVDVKPRLVKGRA